MEIWIALIAVLGTLAGASVGPVTTAIKERSSRLASAGDARASALTGWGVALVALASHPRDEHTGPVYRTHRDAVLTARVLFEQHLRHGEGDAGYFANLATQVVDRGRTVPERVALANHAVSRLFEWSRGERPISGLKQFASIDEGPEQGRVSDVGPLHGPLHVAAPLQNNVGG